MRHTPHAMRVIPAGLSLIVAVLLLAATSASASPIVFNLDDSSLNGSPTGSKTTGGVQINLAASHDPVVANKLTNLRRSDGGIGIDTRRISDDKPLSDGVGIDNGEGSEVMTITFSTDLWLTSLQMGSLELRNNNIRAHDILLVTFTDAGIAKAYDYSSEHVTLISGTVSPDNSIGSQDGVALLDFTALNSAGIFVAQGTTLTLRQATNKNLLVGSSSNQNGAGNGIVIQNITASTVPVPEPAGLVLMGAGGMAIALRRRRQA